MPVCALQINNNSMQQNPYLTSTYIIYNDRKT